MMKKTLKGLAAYTFFAALSIVIFLLIGIGCSKNKKAPVRTGTNDKVVVKQLTDERGLTSVIFYYPYHPSDTFAFDYLTPSEYKREFNAPRTIRTKYVCPDCGEWGCIYEDIDDLSGEGTDSDYEDAIQTVCKQRGITDKKVIDSLRANYYL